MQRRHDPLRQRFERHTLLALPVDLIDLHAAEFDHVFLLARRRGVRQADQLPVDADQFDVMLAADKRETQRLAVDPFLQDRIPAGRRACLVLGAGIVETVVDESIETARAVVGLDDPARLRIRRDSAHAGLHRGRHRNTVRFQASRRRAFARCNPDGFLRTSKPARRAHGIVQAQQQAVAFGRNDPRPVVLPGDTRDEAGDRFTGHRPAMAARRIDGFGDGFKARTSERHLYAAEVEQVFHQGIAHRTAFHDERAKIEQAGLAGQCRIDAAAGEILVHE